MSARRLRSSLALVLLLGVAGGCTVALPPPHQPVSEEARRAIALLEERWRAFTDMRALADVDVDKGGQRHRFTGVLLARAPASLRFEALSPFGQPFLFLALHDDRVTAYNAATNEAAVGRADVKTIGRVLRLPVRPEQLVALMAGLAVPPRDVRLAQLLPADENGPSLDLVGSLNEQRVWMDTTTGVVRRVRLVGGKAAAVITNRFDASGAFAGFDVDAGEGYVTGTVRYRSLTTGVGVDPDRFTLAIPKDAKTQTIR